MVLDDMIKDDNNNIVRISIGQLTLEGDLHLGEAGNSLFAHDSGSSTSYD
jgi:hypothetical protein